MADATVTQGRREDPLPLPKEQAPAAAPRVRAIAIRPQVVLWAGIVIAIGAFLAFGAVRIGAGNWIGLRMPVRRVWAHFTRFLIEQGAATALVAVVTAAAVASLLGAALVLWLAFTIQDCHGDPPADDVPRQ